MANTRALVKRRKAIRNIRKITRTMELIATARFKKAMDRAIEADAFTRKIAELAADLAASATNIHHPLLEKRAEVKNSVLLVLCSNRGLCGGYNASILRDASTALRKVQGEGIQVHLDLSGKRAISYYRYQGVQAEHTYTHFEDKPSFEEVDAVASRYLADYIAGKIDRVDVAYMKFLNAARQAPVVETLLPLTTLAPVPSRKSPPSPSGGGVGGEGGPTQVEYEFLPSAAGILEEILPMSFKIRLFKCFLDSAVSEQIARRVAMKAATENAGEMIRDLSSKYNRARQAQITKEISEIIGGAAALK
ncbi:MAG: ATP synthase F1 subunit gamma [Planctomycetes bacterium]|nr:ATP synthase F1 subunit gamma [Planctomycetota bacterium]